jgi:drug/metabolite transporter (DMT)-like permease
MVYGVPAVLVLPFVLRDRGRGLVAGGWPLLWLGISAGICNYLYAASVVYGDVARIVLLFYVNPVWSVLLERLILKAPITPGRAAALAVGLIGMFILNYDGEGLPLPRTAAEWCGLAAGFCWAVALVTMRMTPQVGMVEKAFLQYVTAMIFGGAILALGVFQAKPIGPRSIGRWPYLDRDHRRIWCCRDSELLGRCAPVANPRQHAVHGRGGGRGGHGSDLDRLSVRLARGGRRHHHRVRQRD